MAEVPDLECPICAEILRNACETTCGHAFCEFCINKWLENNDTCPVCRKSALPVHPSFALRSLVKSLHPLKHKKFHLVPPTFQEEKERGNASFQRGEYAEAIEHYSTSADIHRCQGSEGASAQKASDEEAAAVYANRALCYLKLKLYQIALDDCGSALNLNPRYVKAHLRKVVCLDSLSQREAACRALSDARAADSKHEFSDEIASLSSRLYGSHSAPSSPRGGGPAPPPGGTRTPPSPFDSFFQFTEPFQDFWSSPATGATASPQPQSSSRHRHSDPTTPPGAPPQAPSGRGRQSPGAKTPKIARLFKKLFD